MANRGFKIKSQDKYSERFDTTDVAEFGTTDEDAAAEVAAAHGVDVSDIEVVTDLGDPRGSETVMMQIDWSEANMRDRRTKRLADCDWTQYADSPLSDAKKAEWAAYRAALRDMPTTSPNANAVEWPGEPS